MLVWTRNRGLGRKNSQVPTARRHLVELDAASGGAQCSARKRLCKAGLSRWTGGCMVKLSDD
jgi:hypothetical protein